MKKILIIAVAVLLLGGAGGAYVLGYLPFGGDAQAESADAAGGHGEEGEEVELDEHGNPVKKKGDANYLPINPPFVVNFTHLGTLRFLQISLEVMYDDEALLDKVTADMPAIRNELILLLSDQKFEKLSSLEGKEELRSEMIAAINSRVLDTEHADAHGEVFITNFVMQ